MGKTIIVTGGAGFIGANFVYLQLKEHPEDRIVCLDKLTYAGNLETLAEAMKNPKFRFVKADICDREAVDKLFAEEHPDIVVNFAAESHVDRSIEDPGIFLQTNIIGTQVLMDACRKYGIERYHQVSTDEVYGDLPLDRPDLFFTEQTPLHTSSPYSSSKAGADLLVNAYHRTYGLPTTISRSVSYTHLRTTAAVPVMYRNAIIGGIYLYDYDGEQGSIITGLQQNLLRISLVLLGLALLLSMLLSRTMTRRISRLITGIGKLRKGEYSTRVKVSGRDELATLANAFNDMTQRLETTDEMRRRFVSDASHELKTPLASIKLLTDSIVQNEDMDQETVRDFVQDIGTEADRLARITEKLLALTRMDNANASVVERTNVDLADVITDALHMLTPLADKQKISIHLVMDQGCIVRSTADEMYQVLFNLVENAIKYNVPEGKIWIRARKSADSAVVTIEDTGIGIPQKDRQQIFDRFYRVDKARSREAGGAGLGLSIVRDTVVASGGTITVDGRPEGGTVFIVHLPLVPEAQKKEEQA